MECDIAGMGAMQKPCCFNRGTARTPFPLTAPFGGVAFIVGRHTGPQLRAVTPAPAQSPPTDAASVPAPVLIEKRTNQWASR